MLSSQQQGQNDNNPIATTPKPPRKLRPLVITLGSKRKSYIESLFNDPRMKEHFEPPTFSPGIPSRELRGCYSFLNHASKTGIIPQHEWEAIVKAKQDRMNDENKDDNDHLGLLNCLNDNDVPVLEGRKGSEEDIKKHYCQELWQKAKGINRGRNVLACLFAHLIAMKTLVEEGFDFILEDNVRAPIFGNDDDESADGDIVNHDDISGGGQSQSPCASRIRQSIEASKELELKSGVKCHLRYYGWLGSRPNLEFVINKHCPKTRYKRKDKLESASVFPFPVPSDIDDDSVEHDDEVVTSKADIDGNSDLQTPKKPGGTLLWGAYAYWVSKEGHQAIIDSLQKDVGSLLWKGKRMRHYLVKPIDKVIPRKIMAAFTPSDLIDDGRECVHVATNPAFFRAPMLTSQIHCQWDAEFCRSTEFQMLSCLQGKKKMHICSDDDATEKVWDSLWLTELERKIISHKKVTKEWLTLDQLSKLSIQNT